MTQPNIRTTLVDERNRVTYHVLAYRKLTEVELVRAVRFYLSRQRKKPKRGATITIMSIIGHNE